MSSQSREVSARGHHQVPRRRFFGHAGWRARRGAGVRPAGGAVAGRPVGAAAGRDPPESAGPPGRPGRGHHPAAAGRRPDRGLGGRVTYVISREARVEESERSADVYRQVYDAERPELFFKSAAWRVAGDGQTIAVRADSVVDVPEPEVALVINRFGEIAGYTACNDVSSRTIEGENPLYLPQAKVYLGGCAVGPAIRPSWEIADPYDLGSELTIRREGAVAWHGQASTASLRRKFDDLVGYLMRADIYPDGVVLATGTCLVPPAPFSLADGDVVTVAVAGVGTLTTVVVRGL